MRKLLVEIPDDPDAHEALGKIYAECGRWSDLVELHLKRLEALEDGAERATLLHEVARLLERELDDEAGALDALVHALSEDPCSDAIAADVERLAVKLGRFEIVLDA
ncbi:MAG: hypothetical protein ACXVEF_38110, partial [Polyangiales bacterium]